jgi:hypothetical protein
MKNRSGITFKDLGKRPQINGEWIDQYQVTRPSDLNQSELWVIGPLSVKLRIKRVARLAAKQLYDSSEFALGINDSKIWVRHVMPSDRRCSANDGTPGVNPAVGSPSNVDRVDPLCPKELGSLAAASANRADDVDRSVCCDLVNTLRNSRQRNMHSAGNVPIGVFVIFSNVDKSNRLRKKRF